MRAEWYIVNAVSGFEQKVVAAIKDLASKKGLSDSFEEIFVPTESISELRRGKKVMSERKIYPGYIVVKMVLDDASWNLVRSVPKVLGFLGGAGKPQPISEREVNEIMHQVEVGSSSKEMNIGFAVGENVKIKEGPFETFTGVIDEIDVEGGKLRVSVSIFGRSTSVELQFNQVEKYNI